MSADTTKDLAAGRKSDMGIESRTSEVRSVRGVWYVEGDPPKSEKPQLNKAVSEKPQVDKPPPEKSTSSETLLGGTQDNPKPVPTPKKAVLKDSSAQTSRKTETKKPMPMKAAKSKFPAPPKPVESPDKTLQKSKVRIGFCLLFLTSGLYVGPYIANAIKKALFPTIYLAIHTAIAAMISMIWTLILITYFNIDWVRFGFGVASYLTLIVEVIFLRLHLRFPPARESRTSFNS